MLYKATVNVKPQYAECIVECKCDLCGKVIRDYNRDRVTIQGWTGTDYDDADCRTLHGLDCCEDCFMDKVKPLIEKHFDIAFWEQAPDDRQGLDRAETKAVK